MRLVLAETSGRHRRCLGTSSPEVPHRGKTWRDGNFQGSSLYAWRVVE